MLRPGNGNSMKGYAVVSMPMPEKGNVTKLPRNKVKPSTNKRQSAMFKNAIVELYGQWRVKNSNCDASLVDDFVDYVQRHAQSAAKK